MVGAEIMLHEELLRRNLNGVITEGDVAKDMQTNSRDFVEAEK
jgi:hypothetical protein